MVCKFGKITMLFSWLFSSCTFIKVPWSALRSHMTSLGTGLWLSSQPCSRCLSGAHMCRSASIWVALLRACVCDICLSQHSSKQNPWTRDRLGTVRNTSSGLHHSPAISNSLGWQWLSEGFGSLVWEPPVKCSVSQCVTWALEQWSRLAGIFKTQFGFAIIHT